MRSAYIKCRGVTSGGSRGGVSGGDGDDYELEIGQDQTASLEMIALCVMIDEVRALLECGVAGSLGCLVLKSWNAEVERLRKTMNGEL